MENTPRPRGRPRKKPIAVVEELQKMADNRETEENVRYDEPQPEIRKSMRPEMRIEDPRERAKRRAAEILQHRGDDLQDGVDEFRIDTGAIPEGWTYEWKRKIVAGQEDPAYQVQLRLNGWEEVPADRHPEFLPLGSTANTIERKGMVLMERPTEVTEHIKSVERKKALNQVRQKEDQLTQAGSGEFERSNKGNSMVKLSKSFEPIPVPKD